ncbi:bifunctional phosphoribosylaminoimidazolecarboxamide formyltransferase/IMP cyclohydrolase [Sporomusa sphaeroides]|uniref:Bifunctional purine biosynthesis protein PurH n=1 Tax=Sporomusa sphaeroides DSM 2875 TaxID=1337886 RepID=A0ABP2C8D8_9FIRM|nr:bifunctional phosphoribosylaminoimidazolecarboxamide formyltransferase/IMP cyclohydrolase [Sporomusa sphaeroides]OLS57733.1 bifunctional purine biosynthesis protein PurH [Sporomusa sphaeroides DSM 2875]CVK20570.1 Bifunctional purine biosynthesis protein PurH [Sporomusa sphaeroides DSM 2875]
MKIKRALLSVSDKTGIIEFAQQLHNLGVQIISTGGTMKAIKEAGIPVTYVSEITGFPEIMDGRVKTLNPYIHGGILAIRDNPAHQAAMVEHNIQGIDLVAVNLYPFRQTVAKPDVTLNEAVENIDIGGPAMIRASAKNFHYVTVVVNPLRYQDIIAELQAGGEVALIKRMALAQEAFSHTAGYDAYISQYLSAQLGQGIFPDTLHQVYEKIQDLRYGENPHQAAAFYREQYYSGPGVANARQFHGKELSFNNIVDVEAAYALAAEFHQPAAAIIKHTNPCGTGIGATLAEAYQKAHQADPVSAFGGIVAVNREVDEATAQLISEIFVEAVIAPSFSQAALELLAQKKNIRLLAAAVPQPDGSRLDVKSVAGGVLLQQTDMTTAAQNDMKIVTKRQPTTEEWEQLLFAWKVVKHVKSNAIVIAKDNKTLGVGAGQMNRVGAAGIALAQAGEQAKGAVLASDAFFPFADTVGAAIAAGVTAIIQPGGSVHDEDSIKAADAHGIAMVFTGMRHFKH